SASIDGDRTTRMASTHTNTAAPGPLIANLARSTEFAAGDLIARGFRVKEVRRGGMGIVYIVELERTARQGGRDDPDYLDELQAAAAGDVAGRLLNRSWYALKMSRPGVVRPGRETIDRFERECIVWSTLLPHPNVVRAFTTDRVGGIAPFVLLEYVHEGN